jgi:hypothetical protein
MAKKTEPTKLIQSIKVGSKDYSGHVITDVLSFGNEYAIYEIDTKDINNKLRLVIDGIDDASEVAISANYVIVKDKYITAKGLLYRSADFGLMKSRVANTLATALLGNPDLALKQFEALIQNINDEYKDSFKRRILYILPGYLLLVISVIVLIIQNNLHFLDNRMFQGFIIIASSIVGGVFSLSLNIPQNKFYTEIGCLIFAIFGLERIGISILAGIICAVGIKSRIIMESLFQNSFNVWLFIFLVIIAAFSEKMVPNILGKQSKENMG